MCMCGYVYVYSFDDITRNGTQLARVGKRLGCIYQLAPT